MDEQEDQGGALAIPESSGPPDEYERRYMADEGKLVHRAKQPAPPWMQLLLATTPIGGLALLATSAWAAGLATLVFGVLLWALFSVLRFTVTEKSVNVQFGVFGPKIPMESIEEVRAIEYDWKKFGGWGIRRSLDGEWMYNMPGDGGRAVRMVWRDAKGKRRITNVGMKSPAPAVVEIRRALRSLPDGETRAALPSKPK
jgi:hypothetical protein